MRPEHLYTIIGTIVGILTLAAIVCYGDNLKKFIKGKMDSARNIFEK